MTDHPDSLSYHGRRTVDEMVGALRSNTVAAALVHKELSLMHPKRFVASVSLLADAVDQHRSSPPPSG